MTITVYPVTPTFAAEIGDVDLTKPVADAQRRRGCHSAATAAGERTEGNQVPLRSGDPRGCFVTPFLAKT